jgi:hypothetical protein
VLSEYAENFFKEKESEANKYYLKQKKNKKRKFL